MKKIFLYSLIALLFMPILSKAESYTLLEPLPCIDGVACDNPASSTMATMDLENYIGYIFKFAIALAAFLAVIMIIVGGLQYMTTESFSGKGDAKKRIQDAATGLLMVLASYLILRTIDPRLVEINTSIPPVQIDKARLQAISDFKTRLDSDLNKLTEVYKIKTNTLQSEIDINSEKLKVLTPLIYSGEATPDQEIEYNKLLSDNKQKTAEIITKSAGIITSQNIQSLITTTISNDDNYEVKTLGNNYDENGVLITKNETVELTASNKENVSNSIDAIKNDYAARISELSKSSGNELAIQSLQYQGDFFIKQINDEVEFNALGVGVDKKITQLSELKTMSDKYQKELDSLDSKNDGDDPVINYIKNDPDLKKFYVQTLGSRILKANAIIADKK